MINIRKAQNKIISRSYVINHKDLCKKLEIKGEIQSIMLYCGLSTYQQMKGESVDNNEWEIVTHEIEEDKKEIKNDKNKR